MFRYELDGTEQTEKYPPSFRLTFDTIPSKKTSTTDQDMIAKQLDMTLKKPQCLFKEETEFRQTIEEYGKISFSLSFLFGEKNINRIFFCENHLQKNVIKSRLVRFLLSLLVLFVIFNGK